MFGARHVLRVCTGARYIGSYIGDDDYKHDWLKERTLTWEKNINKISEIMGEYTQESYATVVRAIQSEWMFFQCFTSDTGDSFVGVKNIIQDTFLPRLFFRKTKTFSPVVGVPVQIS